MQGIVGSACGCFWCRNNSRLSVSDWCVTEAQAEESPLWVSGGIGAVSDREWLGNIAQSICYSGVEI